MIFNKNPRQGSFAFEDGEREHDVALYEGFARSRASRSSREGAVVQLVRIPACHAVGREFESRPHRKKESQSWLLFCYSIRFHITK